MRCKLAPFTVSQVSEVLPLHLPLAECKAAHEQRRTFAPVMLPALRSPRLNMTRPSPHLSWAPPCVTLGYATS